MSNKKKIKKKDPKCIGYIIELDADENVFLGVFKDEDALKIELEELGEQGYTEENIIVYKVLREVKVKVGAREEPEGYGYIDE
jgi:hypothetical protein